MPPQIEMVYVALFPRCPPIQTPIPMCHMRRSPFIRPHILQCKTAQPSWSCFPRAYELFENLKPNNGADLSITVEEKIVWRTWSDPFKGVDKMLLAATLMCIWERSPNRLLPTLSKPPKPSELPDLITEIVFDSLAVAKTVKPITARKKALHNLTQSWQIHQPLWYFENGVAELKPRTRAFILGDPKARSLEQQLRCRRDRALQAAKLEKHSPSFIPLSFFPSLPSTYSL